jgi:hypothetical protein
MSSQSDEQEETNLFETSQYLHAHHRMMPEDRALSIRMRQSRSTESAHTTSESSARCSGGGKTTQRELVDCSDSQSFGTRYHSRYDAVWFLVKLLEESAVIEDIGAYSFELDPDNLATLFRNM